MRRATNAEALELVSTKRVMVSRMQYAYDTTASISRVGGLRYGCVSRGKFPKSHSSRVYEGIRFRGSLHCCSSTYSLGNWIILRRRRPVLRPFSRQLYLPLLLVG